MKARLVTCIKLLVQYCVLGGHRRTMAGDDDGRDLVEFICRKKEATTEHLFSTRSKSYARGRGIDAHEKIVNC
jgi:hypothetical protein